MSQQEQRTSRCECVAAQKGRRFASPTQAQSKTSDRLNAIGSGSAGGGSTRLRAEGDVVTPRQMNRAAQEHGPRGARVAARSAIDRFTWAARDRNELPDRDRDFPEENSNFQRNYDAPNRPLKTRAELRSLPCRRWCKKEALKNTRSVLRNPKGPLFSDFIHASRESGCD